MNIRLYYRIEKEAHLAEDEYGNPAEVYNCNKLQINSDNISDKQYEELASIWRKLTARALQVDEKFITPITLDEYLYNVKNDNL